MLALSSLLAIETLAIAWPRWLVGVLIAGFLVICILMILIVLIQKPQGGGLSGAFGGGGGGSGQTAFGTKTGDALTWSTGTIFLLFLVFAVMLTYATRPAAPVTPPEVPTASAAPAGAADDPNVADEDDQGSLIGIEADEPVGADTTADDAPEPAPIPDSDAPILEPGAAEPEPALPQE